MREIERVIEIVAREPLRLACLRAVRDLGLPDAWVGAGFVRNAVWDALTGRAHDPRAHDIDVVFFDAALAGEARAIEAEQTLERTLAAELPGLCWSVTNQARMAVLNGDAPYRDTADAVARWPETATAIAAQMGGEGGFGSWRPTGSRISSRWSSARHRRSLGSLICGRSDGARRPGRSGGRRCARCESPDVSSGAKWRGATSSEGIT